MCTWAETRARGKAGAGEGAPTHWAAGCIAFSPTHWAAGWRALWVNCLRSRHPHSSEGTRRRPEPSKGFQVTK